MQHSQRSEERVGEVVAGKYRLLTLLGAGGMGAVYEAVHQFTQRRVAIKLMHPAFARSGIAAERFLREAQAPSTIGHPGIVEVLDGGHDSDGSLYLVLELLEGETLAHAIKHGSLDPQQAGSVALDLLDALDAAHAAGFVHRDIKPENVFLAHAREQAPLVKLLDFGVAGVLSAETQSKPGLTVAGSVLGTPLYMSPEQALGRRVDGRSDLWSVGAVLYQALAGRAPFGGESFQALIVSISTEQHLPLSVARPELPVRLVSVVERALQKDVARRWQSAAEMAQALQIALVHHQRSRGAQARDPALAHAHVVLAALPAEGAPGGRSSHAPWLLAAATIALVMVGGAVWAAVPGLRGQSSMTPSGEVAAAAREIDPAPLKSQPAAPAAPQRADTEPTVTSAGKSPAETNAAATDTAVASVATATPTVQVAAPPTQPSVAPAALDAAALSDVMQRHDGELQRCHEEAVVALLMQPGARAPDAIGPMRLDVELDVSPSGAVERVALEGGAGAEMKRCATSAMMSWRFPNSSGPTQVRFPVIFQPNIVRR